MTIEEKINIVSGHYADSDVNYGNIKSIVRKAYIDGFKRGYQKAHGSNELQLHDLWRTAGMVMQCDSCRSQFDLANWGYCPVCGTCMDGKYEPDEK